MPAGSTLAAAIAAPRERASRYASVSVSAPAQTRADSSPRLCPTAPSARAPIRSSHLRPASEERTMAGWATAVSGTVARGSPAGRSSRSAYPGSGPSSNWPRTPGSG